MPNKNPPKFTAKRAIGVKRMEQADFFLKFKTPVKKGELLLFYSVGDYGEGPYVHDVYRALCGFEKSKWDRFAFLSRKDVRDVLVQRGLLKKLGIQHEEQI